MRARAKTSRDMKQRIKNHAVHCATVRHLRALKNCHVQHAIVFTDMCFMNT